MSHPCKHHVDGKCTHPDQPYGPKPSAGVCRKVCTLYDGPDRGLGDTIARFAALTGIKKVVDAVSKTINKDCGCASRQRDLNERFPTKDAPHDE